MSSSPVPLKTRRVGERCTLNLSKAHTSSHWCDMGRGNTTLLFGVFNSTLFGLGGFFLTPRITLGVSASLEWNPAFVGFSRLLVLVRCQIKGTVSGILNFVGVIPFFLIPALVGFSTKYERSMAQWRYVYYGTIVVVLITTLVYVVCGTSEPQEWGTYDEEPIEEEAVDLTKKEKPEDQP
ncbi:sialin [Trichonephila clavipes]|nr:sialin [Trichonephila clavipes]